VLYEVTERGLSERPAELLAEVERVRALGFGIAIDDLGTDWRSLALLPFIRPDVVKLDMALIQGPLTDAGLAMATAVRSYAGETGAQSLAEGIETAEHEGRADLFGAELGQGGSTAARRRLVAARWRSCGRARGWSSTRGRSTWRPRRRSRCLRSSVRSRPRTCSCASRSRSNGAPG